MKLRGKVVSKYRSRQSIFAGNVVEYYNAVLSKKADKRIEVVTRALKEIRSKSIRIKFTKDGVLESKHTTL